MKTAIPLNLRETRFSEEEIDLTPALADVYDRGFAKGMKREAWTVTSLSLLAASAGFLLGLICHR